MEGRNRGQEPVEEINSGVFTVMPYQIITSKKRLRLSTNLCLLLRCSILDVFNAFQGVQVLVSSVWRLLGIKEQQVCN